MDNIKTVDEKMQFTESQMRIFLTALNLFATRGFEKVAVGTIAKEAKVKISALYYLGGKCGLLESCYKYFVAHRYDTRLAPEDYMDILKSGTKSEVIRVLLYTFPEDILINMFNCLSVIIARLYIDDNAREIYSDDITQSMAYMKDFFEAGIEMGRFHPFDIEAISILCLGIRVFGLELAIMERGKISKWGNIEERTFNEICKIIPFTDE